MKAPLHLWIIGLAALVLHAGAAYNYLLIQMKNQAYLAQLGQTHRAMLEAAPVWLDAAWAVGVWFAVLGSLLLLARARLARPCFGLALLGVIPASVYRYNIEQPAALQMADTIAGALVLVVLWRYARAMTRAGVLR